MASVKVEEMDPGLALKKGGPEREKMVGKVVKGTPKPRRA
jgi:hypothetical protein